MSEPITAIYVRVSDKDQKHRSQIPDLDRWVTANPDDIVTWFKDTFTGRCLARPGWEKLWEGVESGRIKKVVVWKVDRLGRMAYELSGLYREFLKRDIDFVSITDCINLRTPAGRLYAHNLAASSEYDLEVRAERQAAGIQAIRDENGGKCPWGGGIVGRRKIKEKGQAENIIRLRQARFSLEAIAEMTGFNYRTVRKFLREERV